jgi:hypothetical protein
VKQIRLKKKDKMGVFLESYYCRRSVFVTDVMNGKKDWGAKVGH